MVEEVRRDGKIYRRYWNPTDEIFTDSEAGIDYNYGEYDEEEHHQWAQQNEEYQYDDENQYDEEYQYHDENQYDDEY